MTIKQYLKLHGLSIQAFADGIRAEHETARRYVHRKRVPRPKTAKAIVRFTNGEVTLADLYGV